eukprot:scaffold84687_cov61-Attheya_sp.AAC.3
MPTGIHLRKVTASPVKVSGLSILNAKHSATLFIFGQCDNGTTWSHLDHKVTLKQARESAQLSAIKDAEITQDKLMDEAHMSKRDARIIGHGGKTGGWLTVLPNVMNGSIQSDLEFRDGIRLCYSMTIQNLPTHCDGCNAKCNIDHALNCKEGGWS